MKLLDVEVADAQRLIRQAFAEDLQDIGDLTTDALVDPQATGEISIVSRQAGVLSGVDVCRLVFQELDASVRVDVLIEDGSALKPGSVIAKVSGSMRSLLTGERTALNFLTLLSGTATLTQQFVAAAANPSVEILDTRKTLPGLRLLQKYAVRCGGGTNHRIGLYDAVMIKDNHLAYWDGGGQGLAASIRHVRERVPSDTVIEIEVDSFEQLQSVLPGSPDIVLLDNMPCETLSQCVEYRNTHAPDVLLEASGGVNLQTVAAIAGTGVDRISVGALTHSAKALDIGFDWFAGD